jgi:hypothetical protein
VLRRPTLTDDRAVPPIDPAPKTWVATIGATALAGLLVCGLLLVCASAARPSLLSPPTHSRLLPGWLAGPLHGWWSPPLSNSGLASAFGIAIGLMYVFYVLAFLCAPRLRRRWTIAAIVGIHVIFFVSPPLPLTDVFNYLNYARMEVVHGLNPYATIPAIEPHSDPAFAISNWHHLLSPYGPLFTFITFALVPLGVATSFWIFKAILMLGSLASLWLVWRCAELLHRDPLKATLLVGLNPLVLVWGLGGDHNDFLMMLFVMIAVYLLLSSRSPGFARALAVREDLVGRARRFSPGRPHPRVGAPRSGGGLRLAVAGRAPRLIGDAPAPAPARGPLLARRLLLARGSSAGPGARGGLATLQPLAAAVGGSGPTAGAGVLGLPVSRSERRIRAIAMTRAEFLNFGCGLALICALAIKLPAAILLPIVLVVSGNRRWLLAGMLGATVAILLASYLTFGANLPDLGTQSSLVTAVGLPNLLGFALGLGGETVGLRAVLTVGLLIVVGACWQWARRRSGDWIAPAGAAVFVLLLTLSWQAPWYILWLLPFAALTRRSHLRIATLIFGVYLILAFIPEVILVPPGSPLQHAQARLTQHLVR